MIHTSTRSVRTASLLSCALGLCIAQSSGCGTEPPPTPTGDDAGAACVAQEGEHCGGNIRNPCGCAAGLGCTSGSPLPSGDVGGTCERSHSAAGSGGATAHAGTSSTQGGRGAGSDAGTPDAGDCLSERGEHCGGNINRPCSCVTGLVCTADPGSTLPAGDVGGTCQPPMDDADGGPCVSAADEPCGGNTSRPCACATGLTCTPVPGSHLPFGDVGGTCKPPTRPACANDSECRVEADYCTGCDCRALGPGQSVEPCSGPGVRCLVDPCGMKKAVCDNGKCIAR